LKRSINVQEHLVQTDRISATYDNGVLTVALPKREEAKPRKVTVAIA
jgi:HSP20 family protein